VLRWIIKISKFLWKKFTEVLFETHPVLFPKPKPNLIAFKKWLVIVLLIDSLTTNGAHQIATARGLTIIAAAHSGHVIPAYSISL